MTEVIQHAHTIQSAVAQYHYFKLRLQEDDFTELVVPYEEHTNEDLLELKAQREDKQRQEEEEVIEEPKRLRLQEMASGFS